MKGLFYLILEIIMEQTICITGLIMMNILTDG